MSGGQWRGYHYARPDAIYPLTLAPNFGDACSGQVIFLLCVEGEATIQGNGAAMKGESENLGGPVDGWGHYH